MLEELKTFITVVEYKNFTKAAEVLHLSQPSVSAHIKNLETRFHTVLIHRSVKQKSFILSESGVRLYQYAKEMIQLTEQAYLEVPEDSKALRGHLRLGASLTMGEYILPPFIAEFSKRYPEVELELCIDNTATISQKVKDLTLDLGLVEGTVNASCFELEYLLHDKLVLALPYQENFDPTTFDYSCLHDQKWIVRETGSGTREYVDLFLSSHEIAPQHMMVMSSNYAIIQAVIYGLGVTIMSQVVVAQAASQRKLSIVPLDESFHRHFSYIMPNTIAHTHLCEFFIEELKKYTAHLCL